MRINTLALIVVMMMSIFGCANNPVGKKEPLAAAKYCIETIPQKFDSDGHLYTTLAITKISGYDYPRMLVLSYYSEYPDIDSNFMAVPVSLKYLLIPWRWKWRNSITGALHSLHGGGRQEIDTRREGIRHALSESLKNPEQDWLSGLFIHSYGDSYAHTKYEFNSNEEKAYGVWLGHIVPSLLGNSPDEIAKNKDKYLGYISDLYSTIKLNDESDAEFDSFRENIKTTCKSDCKNFHSLSKDNEDAQITLFMDCMNNQVRPLRDSEVWHAINLILRKTNQ